ncbi:MAG TPA: glycosyltransferase [Gemmatimonadales bacterium]|nr:glycosyltransferase [Gemmatimonadales bacterium]
MSRLRICVACQWTVPPSTYGGTDRVVDWLVRELVRRGHHVTLLAGSGSRSPATEIRVLDRDRPVAAQIPPDVDLAHLFATPETPPEVPYLVSIGGHSAPSESLDRNTVFVSADHASRYGSSCFVYNGLDPEDYGPVDWARPREYLHFLAKAAWRVKNVRGAIAVARRAGQRLVVMGGHRVNISMGPRLTLDPRVRFKGMVGGARKNRILNGSRALLFPVRWNEPFGLAITESLYFGCPVLGTPYGSLPELVPDDVGVLSNRVSVLAEAAGNLERFDRHRCHEWVMDHFTSRQMTDGYLRLYQEVLDGRPLNAGPPRRLEQGSALLGWED